MTGTNFLPGTETINAVTFNHPIVVSFNTGVLPVADVAVPPSAIDANGNWSAALVIPNHRPSHTPYLVRADQYVVNAPATTPPPGVGSELFRTAPFNLPCLTFTVDPTCGFQGDPVTVRGTGFLEEFENPATVAITFTPSATGKPDVTVDIRTDTTFIASLRVPNVPPGNYEVVAVELVPGTPQVVARAPFVVPCLKATITLRPAIGPAGTVTTVIGAGFPPNALVKLSWNQGIRISLSSIRVDKALGFQLELLIFPHDALGPRTLSATPDLSDATAPLFNIATADFLVVPGTEQPHDFSWRR